MSAPWTPSPNPGGQNYRIVVESLKEWLDAQQIRGISHIHETMDPTLNFEDYVSGSPDFDCIVKIGIAADTESREAYTGPNNPGGKMITYQLELEVNHRGYSADQWDLSQWDYYAIMDALKDTLRAEGRNLGRPDVFITAGEYPRTQAVMAQHEEVLDSNGMAIRRGIISFRVTQYLTGFVPE